LPRLVGRHKHHVNYRHLIDTLLRKPGGFRNYRDGSLIRGKGQRYLRL
jgi:hypothetical protein